MMAIAVGTLILFSPDMLRVQMAQMTRDERRAEIDSRQRALWNLEKLKRNPARARPKPSPLRHQLEEDFEKLQLSNYHLSGKLDSTPLLLDYQQIREDAAEIRKRAARLRTNLALPQPEKNPKEKKDDDLLTVAELKSAITSLDALVNSFVWNPVFRKPDIVDVENSMKASLDLESIFRVSEQIRRGAEALAKDARKNF